MECAAEFDGSTRSNHALEVCVLGSCRWLPVQTIPVEEKNLFLVIPAARIWAHLTQVGWWVWFLTGSCSNLQLLLLHLENNTFDKR